MNGHASEVEWAEGKAAYKNLELIQENVGGKQLGERSGDCSKKVPGFDKAGGEK